MRQVRGKGVGVGVGVGSRRERCTSSSMCTYLPDVSPVSPLYLPYISALSAHLVEHVHVGAAQQAAAGALRLAALDDEVVVVADALLNHLVVSRARFECGMMHSRRPGSW